LQPSVTKTLTGEVKFSIVRQTKCKIREIFILLNDGQSKWNVQFACKNCWTCS